MNTGAGKMKEIESVKRGIVLLLLVLTGIGSAWADRGYGHRYGHGYGHRSAQFGFVITPGWGPWYYPPPFYYPPTQPIVIERAPPVYIEQVLSAPEPPETQTNYWYYCGATRAYYPYVNECPGGWQKVLPRSPGQP